MSRKHPGSRHHAALNRRQWARVRRACFERDGWRCQRCGHAGRLEAHHVRPLEHGGAPYDLANIATLCRACHVAEHRRPESVAEARWRALVSATQ